MKSVRRLHLMLGCFFAPALLFFTVSGALQTFQLHVDLKNGYKAPAVLKEVGKVHTEQRLSSEQEWDPSQRKPSKPFQLFVLLMSAGFAGTVALGVVMAFKSFRPRWMVWSLLAAGTILPLLLLMV